MYITLSLRLAYILLYYLQEEEIKMATQLKGTVMPIDKTAPAMEVRAPTADEKKFQAYVTLRRQWRRAKLQGIREKKAREAAEAAK